MSLGYLFIPKSISFFLVASLKIIFSSIFHLKGVREISSPSGETALTPWDFLSSIVFSCGEDCLNLLDGDDVDNLVSFFGSLI